MRAERSARPPSSSEQRCSSARTAFGRWRKKSWPFMASNSRGRLNMLEFRQDGYALGIASLGCYRLPYTLPTKAASTSGLIEQIMADAESIVRRRLGDMFAV